MPARASQFSVWDSTSVKRAAEWKDMKLTRERDPNRTATGGGRRRHQCSSYQHNDVTVAQCQSFCNERNAGKHCAAARFRPQFAAMP